MRALGLSIVVRVVAAIAVNAFYMLLSPKAWFRLPDWILAKGTLTEKRFASGWGAMEVRLAGAAMLAVIAWVLYDSLAIR
jgi:hypothetical protein